MIILHLLLLLLITMFVIRLRIRIRIMTKIAKSEVVKNMGKIQKFAMKIDNIFL